MSKDDKAEILVIDTNYLIDLFMWHPVEFFDDTWTKMEEFLKEGKYIILDIVADEIIREGELKTWLERIKKEGLIVEISDSVSERAAEINGEFKIIDDTTGKSTADPYIIAYAELNSFTVVTREGFKSATESLYKIPDVCNRLGVKYIRLPKEFMEKIGFKN